jgi:putative DNA primase/helicase
MAARWLLDDRGHVVQLAKDTVRGILSEAAACKDDKQREAIIGHARGSEKVGRIQALLTLAQTEPPTPVLVSELDAAPYLLNCPNGTIDLHTGKLRPHKRSDLITKTTGVDFDPRHAPSCGSTC